MINFIAFVICAACAVIWGFGGDIFWVVVESALALVNLPFAIRWLIELFSR